MRDRDSAYSIDQARKSLTEIISSQVLYININHLRIRANTILQFYTLIICLKRVTLYTLESTSKRFKVYFPLSTGLAYLYTLYRCPSALAAKTEPHPDSPDCWHHS